MDDTRRGKAIGGGLIFSGEMDTKKLLKNSIKNKERRYPQILEGDISIYNWTVFGDVAFDPDVEEKQNIFYIHTTNFHRVGTIRLFVYKEKKIQSLKLEVDDGKNKHYMEYKFKNKNHIKFSIMIKHNNLTGHQKPYAILWANGSVRTMKRLHGYCFPKTDPNIILWNQHNQVTVNECCVWIGSENEKLIDTQRELMTELDI